MNSRVVYLAARHNLEAFVLDGEILKQLEAERNSRLQSMCGHAQDTLEAVYDSAVIGDIDKAEAASRQLEETLYHIRKAIDDLKEIQGEIAVSMM